MIKHVQTRLCHDYTQNNHNKNDYNMIIKWLKMIEQWLEHYSTIVKQMIKTNDYNVTKKDYVMNQHTLKCD